MSNKKDKNLALTVCAMMVATVFAVVVPTNVIFAVESGGWVKTWGTTSEGDEITLDIATDSDGNIYAVGTTTEGVNGGFDVLLLKYDKSGNLLGAKTWGGESDEGATGVALDTEGNIYVTGTTNTFGAGDSDVFLLKYSSDGTLLWQKTWGGADYEGEVGLYRADGQLDIQLDFSDIALDSNNNIYLTGKTASFAAGGGWTDVFLLKYSSDGTLLWQKTWGNEMDDSASGVSVDSSGNVYITGYFYNYAGDSGEDVFLLKYHSDGTLLFQKFWGGSDQDEAYGLAVDCNDNIYVTGTTNTFGAGPSDVFLLKYSSPGTLLWQKTWGGYRVDFAIDIAVDAEGNIHLAGAGNSWSLFGWLDAFLLKYDSEGNLTLPQAWGRCSWDIFAGIAVHGGNIYLGSTSANDFEEAYFTGMWVDLDEIEWANGQPYYEGTPEGLVGEIFGIEGIPAGIQTTPEGTEASPEGVENAEFGYYGDFNFDSLLVKFGDVIQNQPPMADAGSNLAISSEGQNNTIVQGTATDPDNDPLIYRWLEGETELFSWQDIGANGEAYLDLGTVAYFSIGEHTLTLEVSDGQATCTDEMILTIENSAPHPAPTGGGVYEIYTPVILGGQVSDFDGDLLSYEWLEGGDLLFSGQVQTISGGDPVALPEDTISNLTLGTHTVTLRVNDAVNQSVESDITIEIIDEVVPTLAPVPNKTILWPPNHKMVDIAIAANASDNSGGLVTLSATVSSDEPQDGLGDGDISPDWTEPVIDQDNGIITLQLRAERSGSGDGRVYTVAITATDESNNSSTANVEIIVPHDNRKK